MKDYWKNVCGWFDWMDLYDEVAMTTPTGSTVVEVGVAFGKSLLYLAGKIKETGKDIRIMAVDPWQPYPEHHFIWDGSASNEGEREAADTAAKYGGVFPAFLHFLAESGYADIVDVVRAPSIQAASGLKIEPHFVFLDAEHTLDSVKADLDAWWSTGPEWMAGHDFNPKSPIHFPGVWQAVYKKWSEDKIEWRGQTCFVARRARLQSPHSETDREYLKWLESRWLS